MKLGTDEFGKVFLGDDFVERIYQGDDQIYSIYKDPKDAEIVFRPTDNKGQLSVPDPYFGYAKINSIKGKSLVWNQMLQNGNFSANSKWTAGATQETLVYGNNQLTITNTIDEETTMVIRQSKNIISEHKYYVSYEAKPSFSGEYYFGYLSSPTQWIGTINFIQGIRQKIKSIFTASADKVNVYIGAYWRNTSSGAKFSVGENIVFYNAILIDLTLMFGAGNEPTTVEEFESLFPLPYYEYNAGTLINNDAEAIESIGFNQWDEEWEIGNINNNTGADGISTDFIRSKNYCPCFGGVKYCIKAPAADSMRIYWYDVVGNYISNNVGIRNTGTIVTAPINAATFRVKTYANSYQYDICINISNPAKNDTYEPYKKFTLPLSLNSFRVKDDEDNIITINGLKSAGSAYDEIRDKYIKRVESVDLGSLNWTYTAESPYNWMVSDALTNAKAANDSVANFITALNFGHYGFGSLYQQYPTENGIAINAKGKVIIRDSAYSDATAFKTAMSGVKLIYELATPITYELVTPIPAIYRVDKRGTEQATFPTHPDGSPSAPLCAEIGYPK